MVPIHPVCFSRLYLLCLFCRCTVLSRHCSFTVFSACKTTLETKKSEAKVTGRLTWRAYYRKHLDMWLKKFSNRIPQQSPQGCRDHLSNAFNASRVFMHGNYTRRVPEGTLCCSQKPAQIVQSQRGGVLKKQPALPRKRGGSVVQRL